MPTSEPDFAPPSRVRVAPPAPPPPQLLSTLVVIVVTGLWTLLRMGVISFNFRPLSYALPLLLCIWTRRRWQLWAMTFIFLGLIALAYARHQPAVNASPLGTLWANSLNVIGAAIITRLVMILRDRLDARTDAVAAQNRELEAQAEELSQQNGEIEEQSERLERQNADLREANERLAVREDMLQAILQFSRAAGGSREALAEVCRRALAVIGEPADTLLVLERSERTLQVRGQARLGGRPPLERNWPPGAPLILMVLQQDCTAYVDDFQAQPELAVSFPGAADCRSVLATPLRAGGVPIGVLVAASAEPTHWTQEQFRLIEWVAAQCGLIVESIRWEEMLVQRAEAVEAANRAKDQFFAALSHELRTPLTPVLAVTGSMERDARLPEDLRQDIAMVRRNIAIQSRLIDDLLDFNRLGRGKLDLNSGELDLGDLLRETAGIVAIDLAAKGQTLALELHLPPGFVAGDGARLQQVFWNLLKNSIRFSPHRGRIAVSVALAPAAPGNRPVRVQIRVSDDGVGIDASDLERIFQPFEQAAAARKRGSPGLGLGLSIAKAIVELHDGSIRAESEGPNRGATFVIELPFTPRAPEAFSPAIPGAAPARKPGPAPGNSPAPAVRPLRILLVEDHADTARVMARLLRAAGHTVQNAENVGEAYAFFEKGGFDLVVSDLGLPDGSGLDLMRSIRAKDARIPGICLSGFGMEADVQASREAGFAEHLIKPVDMERLHAAIRRVSLPAD